VLRNFRWLGWLAWLGIALTLAPALRAETAGHGRTSRESLPSLRRQGTATQLLVEGKPFLVLGGELSNSATSSLQHLEGIWAGLAKLQLNTVLAPVAWEQLEPVENRFDFSLVDGLLRQARARNVRVVLLWFGSWKNSMSSYAPAWVKRDQARFPRSRANGSGVEILSAFSDANLGADQKAFTALMRHLKAVDSAHTVVMVQVENEVGMLPTARDQSPEASARFEAPVPGLLVEYLSAKRSTLVPQLRALWEANGAKTSGNWPALFGRGPAGEEVFTAWFLARYVDAVAASGRAAYPLPLFANVALNRPGKLPGEYPSGGPLPHLLDVWKAAAPSLDFLSPDIYFPNFSELAAKYARSDNPLFVPEANHARLPEVGANAFLAFGEHQAFGFCPFSFDTLDAPENTRMAQAFDVLRQLTPTILEHQGEGRMRGFRPPVTFEGAVDDSPQTLRLGDFEFKVMFVDPWAPRAEQQTAAHGGLLIQLGPEEYLAAGSGFALEPSVVAGNGMRAGIDSIWEGRFVGERWVPGRLLNGDESHQGRWLKMPRNGFGIQRMKLYRYR
jgi:beta-galactosidase GanA